MSSTNPLEADPDRFDRACSSLTNALERFAALTAQIATDIRSTTAALRGKQTETSAPLLRGTITAPSRSRAA